MEPRARHQDLLVVFLGRCRCRRRRLLRQRPAGHGKRQRHRRQKPAQPHAFPPTAPLAARTLDRGTGFVTPNPSATIAARKDAQSQEEVMSGPLSGLTIVELAGIGPGPMCSMMLGDMGADVIRVDRTTAHVMDRFADPKYAVHNRSRRSVSVDLQKKEGVEVVMRLIDKADGITEPFRPGVAERLGLGRDLCLKRNPKLVYGRMTGWGQEGPLAKAAGHDINYIALTGALHAIGVKAKPTPPLNLVGDFGGGAIRLASRMVSGLLDAQRSGKGQVIDAAMVDGAALLL